MSAPVACVPTRFREQTEILRKRKSIRSSGCYSFCFADLHVVGRSKKSRTVDRIKGGLRFRLFEKRDCKACMRQYRGAAVVVRFGKVGAKVRQAEAPSTGWKGKNACRRQHGRSRKRSRQADFDKKAGNGKLRGRHILLPWR